MVSFPSCSAIHELKEKADLTIALSGSHDTGKSTIFNQITGFNSPVTLKVGATSRALSHAVASVIHVKRTM